MINNKDDHTSADRKMTVTGKGQVTVNPDLAVIHLGVLTTGSNVTEAQSENARISQNVLESLRQLGITEISTYQYQIEKVYEYENGNRIDRGYSVRNIFEIRMENMGLVGTAIDTAVYHGANIVESINFEVSDPDNFYQQALNLAVKNAFQKARTISGGIRIMLDPIPVRIIENTAVPIPYSPNIALREGAYTTPIEPGSKQIEASVTVEFVY
jgi:uncharacterized protein YggE